MSTLDDDAFARSTLKWALVLVTLASMVGLVARAIAREPLDSGTTVGALALVLCALVYFGSRRWLRAATWVFLGGSWLAALGISAARGPTYVAMIPLFLLLVLVAGLILGVRTGVMFGALSCAAVGVLVVLQDLGVMPAVPPPTVAYRASAAVVVTGGITAVFSIALARMRRLLEDLERARLDLERTVEARTRSLIDARDAAQAASRAKSAFVANVSHELRTPLNAVVGMSDALLTTGLSAEQRVHASALRRGADALTSVVNDVLDLASLESGRLSFERAPFDPRAVMSDVVALMEPEAARRKLPLVATVDAGVPARVTGDARRVRQILLNLVGNALKFTDAGRVELTLHRNGHELAFLVADTGPGIAPEFLPRIFEPFARADGTKPGIGLGLPISMELATRLGGRIDVESVVGEGSRFILSVPAAEAFVAVAEPAPRVENCAALKVLIAEDNELNVAVMTALLRALGHQSEVAMTGARARAAVRNAPYDVVLMDVQMPELDGVEATRRLVAELGPRAPYVIGVTADAQPEQVKGFYQAGMADVLCKPVHLEMLGAALARVPRRDGP